MEIQPLKFSLCRQWFHSEEFWTKSTVSILEKKFGLEKYANIAIKRGHIIWEDVLELTNGNAIRYLAFEEEHKYLGLMEASNVFYGQFKKPASLRYIKWIQKS